MPRIPIGVFAVLCSAIAALADPAPAPFSPPPRMPPFSPNAIPVPVVVYDANGDVVPSFGVGAGGIQIRSFQRMGKSASLPVGTTPQTYAIVQPDGATDYRGINPCFVDVVISSVTVSLPVTTQPVTMNGKTVPGVLLVTSASESVSEFEDTLFMARSGRTLGSSTNPMGGSTRYVSIMALSEPAAPCAFRLGYGRGS